MKNKNKFLSYLIALLGIILFCLVVVAGTVWIVDPFNELGRNWTGLYFLTERQEKGLVAKFPHNAILLGSSRTSHINPDDLCDYKFYNASFASALPEEMYYYSKKFIKDEKMVVIGLDFYMFNEHMYPMETMKEWPEHWWPLYEYLLGRDILMDSLKAVYYWSKHVPSMHVDNGYYEYPDEPFNSESYHKWLKFIEEHHYGKYILSQARLDYMRQLKAFLDTRHIKYIVFINPIQEDDAALLRASSAYPIFIQWKKQLEEIFPDLKDLSQSKYSAKKYFHQSDPSHYLTSAGAELVNGMLGCKE